MDSIINCILQVCCPPEAARDALAKFLRENASMDDPSSDAAADCITKYFDLAPQGTLQPFKDAIAKLARGEDYKG